MKIPISVFLLPVFFLVSCSGIFFEKAIENHHEKLGKKIAIFPVYASSTVPETIQKRIEAQVMTAIKSTGFFDEILDAKTILTYKNSNGELSEKMDIYFDTVLSVSVSDWDLANFIGKMINANTFFIVQISLWPCEKCLVKDRLRMKYRIIDSSTNEVIWTALEEEVDLDSNATNLPEVALTIAERIDETFYHRFKEKWHKKRFRRMALLVN